MDGEKSKLSEEGGSFSWALEMLREGKALYRKNWNGKGMYLYLVGPNDYPAQTEIAKKEFGEMVPYGAYIAMKTAQGNVVPWNPSQTCLLAFDWNVVEAE